MDLLQQQFDKLLLVTLALVFAFLAWHGYHYNEAGLTDFAQSNIKLLIGALLFSMRSGSSQDRMHPPNVNIHLPNGTQLPIKTVEAETIPRDTTTKP